MTDEDDFEDVDEDTDYVVRESSDKVRLSWKSKRGDDTRDEDVIKVKTRGETADEAVELLRSAQKEVAEDLMDEARKIQPDAEMDTDDLLKEIEDEFGKDAADALRESSYALVCRACDVSVLSGEVPKRTSKNGTKRR